MATTTLTVTEDAYTIKSQPTKNTGGRTYAFATSGENTAYLKFDTSQIPQGSVIESVYLELYTKIIEVTQPGVTVYSASNNWQESTLTYNNRPSASTSFVVSAAAPQVNKWVRIDLDPTTVKAGDFTSFQLKYAVANSNFQFSTKETSNAPKLTVVVAEPVEVPPKKISIPAVADTFVEAPRPDVQHGADLTASATAGNTRAYIKFDTSELPANIELLEADLLIYTSQLYTSAPGI